MQNTENYGIKKKPLRKDVAEADKIRSLNRELVDLNSSWWNLGGRSRSNSIFRHKSRDWSRDGVQVGIWAWISA